MTPTTGCKPGQANRTLPDAATMKAAIDALKQDVKAQEENAGFQPAHPRHRQERKHRCIRAQPGEVVRPKLPNSTDEIARLREQNQENARKAADLEKQVNDAQDRLLSQKAASTNFGSSPSSRTPPEPARYRPLRTRHHFLNVSAKILQSWSRTTIGRRLEKGS